MMNAEPNSKAIAALVRSEWGRLFAGLMARFPDVELVEDALQDAVLAALDAWQRQGLPANPAAWLAKTARHKAIDRLRRESTRERLEFARERELNATACEDPAADEGEGDIPDERLRLIFLCCHPALGESARIALTLREMGGLPVEEIARAFLVSETTMRQRLVRAKRKIRASKIPFRLPEAGIFAERLASVHATLYLIFHAGYAPGAGPSAVQTGLCDDAIRLGRVLHELRPRDGETAGLLALMLLHHARSAARSPAGDSEAYIPIEDQDRGLWDRVAIREGEALLNAALLSGAPPGPYQIQAAISALYAGAASYRESDWPQIVLLYDELIKIAPSPIAQLNQIAARVAGGMLAPGRALTELDALAEFAGSAPELERYQPFIALRADLRRRSNDCAGAAADYRRAIEMNANAAERAFLRRRLQNVEQSASENELFESTQHRSKRDDHTI